MNELHKELLMLWKEVKVVLDREKINYFAIGGTAIGAIREKGFIPWDDDLDICIYEEEIPRALKALERAGISTNSKWLQFNPYPFFKAYGKKEISAYGEKDNVYIDIFPAQKERKWTKLGWKMFRMRDNLLYAKSKRKSNWIKGEKGKGVFYGLLVAKWLTFWIPTKWLVKKQWKAIDTSRIVENAQEHIRYSYFKDNDVRLRTEKRSSLKFEDSEVVVCDSFAKDHFHIFGDITIKPESKQRISHNIKLLKEKNGK